MSDSYEKWPLKFQVTSSGFAQNIELLTKKASQWRLFGISASLNYLRDKLIIKIFRLSAPVAEYWNVFWYSVLQTVISFPLQQQLFLCRKNTFLNPEHWKKSCIHISSVLVLYQMDYYHYLNVIKTTGSQFIFHNLMITLIGLNPREVFKFSWQQFEDGRFSFTSDRMNSISSSAWGSMLLMAPNDDADKCCTLVNMKIKVLSELNSLLFFFIIRTWRRRGRMLFGRQSGGHRELLSCRLSFELKGDLGEPDFMCQPLCNC